MNPPLYTTDILRLAAALPEPVRLAREGGRAELRSPTCGSRISVAVEMTGERLNAVSVEVQACAFGQAAAAIMARHAAAKDADEVAQSLACLTDWLAGRRDDPGDWPDLDALEPARARVSRHGAILLPFRALVQAMESAAYV
jgi:NifU-like protein involved in Fe-S cluster formation